MVIKWQTINSLILELQEVVFVFQAEGLQRQRRKEELTQRIQQAAETKMGESRQLRKLLRAVDPRNENHPSLYTFQTHKQDAMTGVNVNAITNLSSTVKDVI